MRSSGNDALRVRFCSRSKICWHAMGREVCRAARAPARASVQGKERKTLSTLGSASSGVGLERGKDSRVDSLGVSGRRGGGWRAHRRSVVCG